MPNNWVNNKRSNKMKKQFYRLYKECKPKKEEKPWVIEIDFGKSVRKEYFATEEKAREWVDQFPNMREED